METAISQTNDPAEHSFLTLKSFIETRAAVMQALKHLENGVEIGIVIGNSVECTLMIQDERPRLERRPARGPDVTFSILPETVELLSERTNDDLADIGANLLKEMLAGNVSMRVETNVLDLLRRGYLRVAAAGSTAINALLERHNLTGVSEIMTTIKRMRP
jgi:hypothetical protein